MFVDYTKIELHAGSGGAGCISFRREKYIPKGGPNGGNGGKGGSVIVLGDTNLHTLQDIRYNRIYKAKNGTQGSSGLKTGRNGDDIIIRVPIGTLVKNFEQNSLLFDIVKEGQEEIVCKGGIGGRGNVNFKSSTHQTPRYAQKGIVGESGTFEFELKVLADIGLVGMPNAGKSTLLSVLSKAKPKIAGYPFTTLEPNLGIVKTGEYRSFVMADIPGLIEGASKGKGLGLQFLRHIERNRILLFLIDGNQDDPLSVFKSLCDELKSYNSSLLLKPIILVRTKGDTLININEEKWVSIPEYFMEISAVSRDGLIELVREISNRLEKLDKQNSL